MKISALIPAYNEEKTIVPIIEQLKQMEELDEIVVINDGSQDKTEEVSRTAGARVISLEENQGKGAALQKGFECIKSDIILMLDGDLIGLDKQHIHNLLQPILDQQVDMTVGVFNEGRGLTDLAQLVSPNLSGQRAIKAELLKDLKNLKEAGYGVEIAINRYVKKHGKLQFVELPELTHVMKEEKLGLAKGILARAKMYWEIIKIIVSGMFS